MQAPVAGKTVAAPGLTWAHDSRGAERGVNRELAASPSHTDSEKFRNSYGILLGGTSTTQYRFQELEEHPASFWMLQKWTESVSPHCSAALSYKGRGIKAKALSSKTGRQIEPESQERDRRTAFGGSKPRSGNSETEPNPHALHAVPEADLDGRGTGRREQKEGKQGSGQGRGAFHGSSLEGQRDGDVT